MSILVDENTRLVVSGLTGREGSYHSLNNRRYGTNLVAGVTPGKGDQDVEGVPVFNTFRQAVAATAWRKVLKTGTPSTSWSPLPGVTPATRFVP